MNFQQLIAKLHDFWSEQGCVILQPYDLEMGAGTFHPATALRALGKRPWQSAYVQPCRRPGDGRYGENPNRLGSYHQFQVILKPAPANIQDLYLQSLDVIGVDRRKDDVRFNEDNWESPTLGAAGLGWECWINGQEVSQFTYFQQVMGLPCDPVSGEITYGLERLAMHLQEADSVFNLKYSDSVTYGDLFLQSEQEFSRAVFDFPTDAKTMTAQFEHHESECSRLLDAGAADDDSGHRCVLPAYDHCIKASHMFNLLDASGAISVSDRQGYILRIRKLAKSCGKAFLETEFCRGTE